MPNVLTFFVLVFAGTQTFSPFTDLDWTWHIRTGREILRTGSLSPPDTFTYTIAGRPLPDFEWLYEVILALTHDAFGMGGLKVLRLLLVAAPLVLLARRLKHAGTTHSAIVLSVVASMALLAPFWNLRPLFVTTIGLLFVTGWLKDLVEARDPRWWTLPAVMLLWSNLHPGVLAGMALLAGAMIWEWVNVALGWNPRLSRERLVRLSWVGGLGLAAAFVCPDPLGRFRYAASAHLRHPVMRFFTEMQPLHEAVWNHLWPLGVIYLITGVMLVGLLRGGRAVRGWEWGLIGGTALLAHVAVRAVPDFLLVSLALGVPHLKIRVEAIESRFFALQPRWLAAVLGLLAMVMLIPPLSRRASMQETPHWPVRAADFAERSGLRGNVFASPLFGTYVAWRLPDDVKSYADTRGFFFPPAVLEDSYFVPMCRHDWQARLERILREGKTDYFLLETTGPFGELHRRLKKTTTPIHEDEIAAIYESAQLRAAPLE